MREEIQILRAFAVIAVVVYHFWPHRLPGGFVGVDVFFAISGYLITSHLLRELDRTGRISLPAFWARRVRRLLPAALVVLAFVAVGTRLFVPRTEWAQALREIIGSTLYVQNWVLAGESVDYLSAENAPSPVQHFWSLSTEEQFYLVWPVLVLLVALVLMRLRTSNTRVGLGIVIATVTGASFAWCLYLTATDPGPAYFVTTTRAWEFAGGGLLAVLGASASTRERQRALVAWGGWALLAVSLFVITPATPFPGWIALVPVTGALVVIWAGTPDVSWAPHRIAGVRPVLLTGDLSYSIYLWHWPVLVFAGYQIGTRFSWSVKLVYLVAIVAVSWFSHRCLETPVRRSAFLSRRPARYTMVGMAVAVALVAVPVAVAAQSLQSHETAAIQAARAAADRQEKCFGAGALAPENRCPAADPKAPLAPPPGSAHGDVPTVVYDNDSQCITTASLPDVKSCRFGTGPTQVAMVGNSHDAALVPAVEKIASANHWTVTAWFKERCPFSTTPLDSLLYEGPHDIPACTSWNAEVEKRLAQHAKFAALIVSHSVEDSTYASTSSAVAGFQAAWKPVQARGTAIIVVRDMPKVADDTVTCLSDHLKNAAACDVPRAAAVHSDDMFDAAAGISGVKAIDLTKYLCTATTCPAAIGGVTVYRDSSHLTATFAATLAPYLGRAIDRALQ